MIRAISAGVILFGLVALVIGGIFVGLGASKSNELTLAMQQEQVNLTLQDGGEPTLIDNQIEARAAADLIREHRHKIAPTYQQLLGNGRFDPTNPQQLSYGQALNMENYLYLAVVGYGLTQAVMGSGAFMMLTGLAFVGIGIVLFQSNRR